MICWFNLYNAACACSKSFLGINIFPVFIGLKLTNQSFAHLVILSKSEFKIRAAERGFSTTKNKLVSSAKSLMFGLMSFIMSLKYKRKTSGPRTEPWGTPACM